MQSSPKHNPVPTEQRENRADANPNRPLTGERVRKDLPGNMCLRHFVLAPKASFETSGKWSSLPFVMKRRCASSSTTETGNGNDKRLWKFPHNMSANKLC